MSDALAPKGAEFRNVSQSLAKVRTIVAAILLGVPAIVFVVLGYLFTPLSYYVAGFFVLIFLWLLWLIPRQVRATMYATTDTDFLVRRGVMFRRMDIVPYGRIQYVDVSEGPIARSLGIAEVRLRTAAASSDVSLDGLPVAEAAVLRDLLVANGASGLSGL